jgi:hypothetical protein
MQQLGQFVLERPRTILPVSIAMEGRLDSSMRIGIAKHNLAV